MHVQLLTQDAQDLCFSPSGSCLCVWDSLDYNIFIHAMDGSCLASYRAFSEPALGIRVAHWGPSGQLLALGGFDNVCLSLPSHCCDVMQYDESDWFAT